MTQVIMKLKVGSVVLAGLGTAALLPISVHAATVAQQGWWSRLPVAVGTPVGEDQLLVQGAPDDALATAAVRFTLGAEETAEELVLPVAEQQLQPGAVVVACTTSLDWAPTKGGAWADRPVPECDSAVEGVLAANGESWSFAVAPLQAGDELDVVLLPSPNTSMRVVFEGVTSEALRVSGGGSASTSPDLTESGSSSSLAGGGSSASDGISSPASGAGFTVPALPDPAVPSAGAASEIPAAGGSSSVAAPRIPAAPGDLLGDVSDAGRSNGAGVLALMGALVLAFVALRKERTDAVLAPAAALVPAGQALPSSLVGTAPGPVAASSELPSDVGAPLVATSVSVHFGGVRALEDVSIRVGPGEIVGLIGGNGAGKTTFMDCVSGYVTPDEGSITTFGQELLGASPEMRPYLSVARGYQSARLYPGLTLQETLLVALERKHPTGVLAGLLKLRGGREAEAAKRQRADEVIETLGLAAYRDKRVGELSTGTRRVLDLACMLAQEPKLLLLDEPTTGLAQRETEAFGPLLQRLQHQLGCAVLIIEHDIVLISSVCDRVYALESGRVLAEGDPDTVRRDPRVVASYLGTDDAAIFRSGSESPAADPSTSAQQGSSSPAPSASARAPGTAPRVRRGARTQPLRARGEGPLDELNRAELLDHAAELGFPGRHRMRKSELLEALRDA